LFVIAVLSFIAAAHCYSAPSLKDVNKLIEIIKAQNNEPLYSNTMIGTLAVDGWAVTFGTARRGYIRHSEKGGLGGLRPRPVPSWHYYL